MDKVEPEGYQYKKIELQEQFQDIPAGAIGHCTKDKDGIFAVTFAQYG